MKGLEIARQYYEICGKEGLQEIFPDLAKRVAVGLAGEGSECFGYDDGLSRDHDFEPGFCLWMTREDYERDGFRLERWYAKLPREFHGISRLTMSPVGGSRHGVMVIEEFYQRFLGRGCAPTEPEEWLYLPSESLAAACNGEVFCDELGAFSAVRRTLLSGYPDDVRRKKLAAHLVMMLQTGLYNYPRCAARGENGAAQLCVFEFVKNAIAVIYLLNRRYVPFYKWVYRGMRDLAVLGQLETSLSALTELGNSEVEVTAKTESMEDICRCVIRELQAQELTKEEGYDLQRHALSIQHGIKNAQLRNMHILDGI